MGVRPQYSVAHAIGSLDYIMPINLLACTMNTGRNISMVGKGVLFSIESPTISGLNVFFPACTVCTFEQPAHYNKSYTYDHLC